MFIQKLNPGFKIHMRNLDNFRQALEIPRSWNLMGYSCPKSKFLQLKHFIYLRFIKHYFQLLVWKFSKLLMLFLRPQVIFYGTTPLCFLTRTLHTFYKSSPSKCKFSDFPLLVIFEIKNQFFFKVWIFFQCHER